MKLPRLSTFPLDKPFEKHEPDADIAEISLRLVLDIFSDTARVIGTATPLCGNLLITAKHVIEETFDGQPTELFLNKEIQRTLSAVQILPRPEPEYFVWDVLEVTMDPISDIAVLRIGGNPKSSNPESKYTFRQPPINPFPPDVGERVAAFGYRNCSIKISKNDQGGPHVDLNGDLMASIGEVKEIFEMRRDQRLPFPCYQVSARFDGGMSGGAVIDETGCLCGLVCSNVHESHVAGEPISYVTTLWPFFRIVVGWDRGDNYPRGIRYPAIELARGRQIVVSDLPRLERWFATKIGPHAAIGP